MSYYKPKHILLLVSALSLLLLFACEGKRGEKHKKGHHGGHGGETHARGAVLEAHEKKGVLLRAVALKRLDLKTASITGFRRGRGVYLVPNSALVQSENLVEIYVLEGERLRSFPVRVKRRGRKRTLIRVSGIQKNQALVVGNADLARLAYIEAFGASGAGHGH